MVRPPARADAAGLPAAWLRDNCRCAECLDPATGQRLRNVTDLPAGLTVSQVTMAGGQVTVLFQPDGHRAMFDPAWLARHAAGPGAAADPRTEDAKRLWPAPGPPAGPPGPLPRLSWPRYLADPGYRRGGFYAAYRAFAELTCDPAAMRTVRLAPGDCAIFDNTRILHGRTGFTGPGGRHLQGCYADLDGVESAVAVAAREREKGKDRS